MLACVHVDSRILCGAWKRDQKTGTGGQCVICLSSQEAEHGSICARHEADPCVFVVFVLSLHPHTCCEVEAFGVFGVINVKMYCGWAQCGA